MIDEVPDRRQEILDRIEFLRKIAAAKSEFLDSKGLSGQYIIDDSLIKYCVSCYFCISDQYKRKYLEKGARTKNYKIAAIQSLVIATVHPFRNVGTDNVTDDNLVYMNESFSFLSACAVLNMNVAQIPPNLLLRKYLHFRRVSLKCIENIFSHYMATDSEIYELRPNVEDITVTSEDIHKIMQDSSFFQVLDPFYVNLCMKPKSLQNQL